MKFISKVDEKRDVIGHLRIVTQHVMNRSSNHNIKFFCDVLN